MSACVVAARGSNASWGSWVLRPGTMRMMAPQLIPGTTMCKARAFRATHGLKATTTGMTQ